MNKLKVKNSYTLYTLLALVLLAGCSEFSLNSEKFVIRKMESYDSIYRYELMPTKGKGLLHIRSKHFYKVGDTLTLKPN
jgi:hypothetical protein